MTASDALRRWGPRALAVLVFIGAALLAYVLASLPVATAADSRSWVAARTERLTLGLDPAGLGAGTPILSLNGPPGEDVSMTFVQAEFGAPTRALLRLIGREALADKAPAGWISRGGGGERASVTVMLEPTGPNPTLSLTPTATGQYAEVALRAHDARMILRLVTSVSATAPGELIGPSRNWVTPIAGEGAFPVEVVAPPGVPAVLKMPQDTSTTAEFQMGAEAQTGRAASLSVRSLSIGADDAAPGAAERQLACGAEAKAISWTSTQVTTRRCQPALRVVDMAFQRDGVSLEVHGPAFLAADGEAVVLPLQKVTDNPLVSIALGGLYAAIAAWTWRTLMRRNTPSAEPDASVSP